MTKNEALQILDTIPTISEQVDALEMAIKALEQQPCEDEYIRVPKKALKYRTAGMVAYNAEWLKKHWQMELKVMGIECDDAISREMALKECHDIVVDGERYRVIQEETLLGLPPVTQKSETVTEFADRCRECGKMRKGHWIWNFDKGYCKCSECGIGMGHKEFDYCPNCGCRMVEPQESEEV